MNILTSLQKLAGGLKQSALNHWSTGIVAALAVCSSTPALGQVSVKTLGGGPFSQDTSTTPGSYIITFTGGTGGGAGIKLDNPLGMSFDASGNLYIAENGQGNILKVTNPGDRSTSFTYLFATGLSSPVDVKVASNGDVYVLNSPTGGGSIVRYNSSGTLLGTITTALVNPTALALNSDGNLLVSEIGGAIKSVTTGGVVTTLSTGFTFPTGISLYSTNRLAIADAGDNSIKILNLTNTANITLLAGGNGAGYTNGSGFSAAFNTPRNLSTAPNGSLVVADQNNHRVRIISSGGVVDTIYGVATNSWDPYLPNSGLYPGWRDGTNAHANSPFGVIVGPGATNVFVTEIGHPAGPLLRVASGFSLAAQTGTNNTTTNVFVDTTLTNVVISLGFATGEGSSDYEGFPGQTFQVPVTLTMPLSQAIYSMGFTIGVTNIGGSPLTAVSSIGFSSKLKKPFDDPAFGKVFTSVDPQAFVRYTTNIVNNGTTLVTNYIPVFSNTLITNVTAGIMGVSWLEMPQNGVLYPKEQDLVSHSMAYFNDFAGHSLGKVIVGSFSFKIPDTAPVGSEYRVQVYNASGTSALNVGLDIQSTGNTNALALGPGNVNSIKRIIVQPAKSYLVGDLEGFRWYNVGEFGDRNLKMIDVQEIFIFAAYRLNVPFPVTSDLYNAADSYNIGSGIDPLTGNIDNVTTGDGDLTMDDVLTTLRRTVDPTVKWIYRFPGGIFASNGVGVPYPTYGTASQQSVQLATTTGDGVTTVAAKVDDVVQASGTINVPVHAVVSGSGRPNRLMLSLVVEQHGGAPALSEAVGFTPGSPSLIGVPGTSATSMPSIRQGNNGIALFWNETTAFGSYPGLTAGDNLLGTLSLRPSRPLVAGEYYRIKIAGFSASPGYAFRSVIQDGLVSSTSLDSVSTLGDGISDAWRKRFFFATLSAESLSDADPDGDGIPNWKEFLAGTNPLDKASGFKLTKSNVVDSGVVTIKFMTVLGKSYVVESCSSIGAPWVTVGSTVTGTGDEVTVSDNSSGASGKFYRIRLVDSTSPTQ